MTVEEALKHPYLAEFSEPEDEPAAEAPFSLDDRERSIQEWKGLMDVFKIFTYAWEEESKKDHDRNQLIL